MSRTLVGALRVTLGLDSVEFESGVSRAQVAAQRLGRHMRHVGAAMSIFGGAMAVAVRGQVDAADEMAKAAQRAGVSIEEFSALAYAADLSGLSMEQLETALKGLSRVMEVSEAEFASMGIAVRDANGEMRPTREVLAAIANVMAGMPDGAAKTALAMRLMGRSGADMIPLLNGGADSLKQMTDEAAALGLVFTQETGDFAQGLNDDLARLGAALTGLARIVTVELVPILADVAAKLVEWARAFQNLSPQTREIIASVAALSVALGPVLVAVGALVPLIVGLVSPIGLVVVGIGGLAAAFIALSPGIADADAKLRSFNERLAGSNTAMRTFMDGITDIGQGRTNVSTGLIMTGINIARGLADGIRGGAPEVRSAVEATNNEAMSQFKEDWEIQSPSRVAMRFGRFISEGLGLGIEGGAPRVQGAINGLIDTSEGAADRFSSAGGRMADMFASAFSGIVTGAQSAREAISNLLGQLAQMLANAAFKSLFGSLFDGLKIPGYAVGTPSAARGLALVGEQGPELVNFGGGERVWTAGQTARMMEGGAAQPQVNFRNINVLDASLLGQYLDTPGAERQVINIMRRNGLAAN